MTQPRNDGGDGPRALTARSVLASALLGEDPPELPVAHLVHLAGLFGIGDNRARVALSRMVAAGEAVTDGRGTYRLAGPLLERAARQRQGLRAGTGPWDGTWHLVVVAAPGRSAEERSHRRRLLTASRLAEQREGVWLRPANLPLDPAVIGHADVVAYTARPEVPPGPLAADLFDLAGWAAGADRLLALLAVTRVEGPDDLAGGFVRSAAVVRHLAADPLLPDPLLPAGWPGPVLRDAYRTWDARYREVLRAWGRAAAGR
jgi:phenylacetic acid degradation operon negative regulatory protein